eukprot:5307656-Pleurochrysis_carterae.AAC.9
MRCCWEAYQRKLFSLSNSRDGKLSQLVAEAAAVEAPQSTVGTVGSAAGGMAGELTRLPEICDGKCFVTPALQPSTRYGFSTRMKVHFDASIGNQKYNSDGLLIRPATSD